jgi:hypothetical protein
MKVNFVTTSGHEMPEFHDRDRDQVGSLVNNVHELFTKFQQVWWPIL